MILGRMHDSYGLRAGNWEGKWRVVIAVATGWRQCLLLDAFVCL